MRKDETKISKVKLELKEVKSIVPKCLRLSNTCFTQLSITTSNGEEDMEIHVDEGDIINAVFHLGTVKSGGSTLYFTTDGKKDNMKLKHDIPFQHGRVQIGLFNKIYQCAQSFQGILFALNFNEQSLVLVPLNLKRNFDHLPLLLNPLYFLAIHFY